MKKPTSKSREQGHARPIALVCVSRHEPAGPQAKEPDKLTLVRGKWAWCPSGAADDHEWQATAAGSLNELRVQLVEVSRLVDVALNSSPLPNAARNKTKRPRSREKQR